VDLAIAHHVGLVGRVFLQRSDGLLGAALLRDSDDGIEDQDGEDDGGVDEGAPSALVLEEGQDKRDGGGAEKNEDELVFELFEYEFPEGRRGLVRDRYAGTR
jgi:hypothetical protein